MNSADNKDTSEAVAYSFDDCIVCLRQRVVWVHGERVALETRAFNVLTYLIEHHDRAVSKEELEANVWRGRPLSETVLARSIMKARQALGDDPEQQHYIRTVRGFGYQFVGNVEVIDASQCMTANGRGAASAFSVLGRIVDSRGCRLVVIASAILSGSFLVGEASLSGDSSSDSPRLGDMPSEVMVAVEPLRTGTQKAALDSTAMRLTTIMDRELGKLPWLEVVTVGSGRKAQESGFIPAYYPVLRGKLERRQTTFCLSYSIESAGDARISGRMKGTNPRELAYRLVSRVKEKTYSGQIRKAWEEHSPDDESLDTASR